MKKYFDARSLNHATLEYIRFQAVKAVRSGISVRIVAKIFGVCISKVYEWVKKAEKKGLKELNAKPVPGRKSFLNEQQKNLLTLWLCIFTPLDFGFETVLWTTKIIMSLIKEKFFIVMSRSAVNRLLHRIGLTPQRPIRRALERNAAAVKEWVNNKFNKIKELANKQGAKIYFMDEAGARSDYHAGRHNVEFFGNFSFLTGRFATSHFGFILILANAIRTHAFVFIPSSVAAG